MLAAQKTMNWPLPPVISGKWRRWKSNGTISRSGKWGEYQLADKAFVAAEQQSLQQK